MLDDFCVCRRWYLPGLRWTIQNKQNRISAMKSLEEQTCSPIARLVHKSLHLCLPSAAPYDTESALETFAGENVLPIASALHWFWFSRYGKVGDWEIKFRFATSSYNAI